MKTLVVVNPFNGLEPGDRITDPLEVKKVLAGEHSGHVVVTRDEAPVKTASKE